MDSTTSIEIETILRYLQRLVPIHPSSLVVGIMPNSMRPLKLGYDNEIIKKGELQLEIKRNYSLEVRQRERKISTIRGG